MNKTVYTLLVLITTALMGSSFAIGKIGLTYASPLFLIAIRFILAGLLMAIAIKFLKQPLPKKPIEWLKLVVIGFFQTACAMGFIFLSLRTITASESSILTFTNPLLVVIIGSMFFSLTYGFRQWTGVILGFVGVFITFGADVDIKTGTFIGFAAALSWAIGTLLIKQWGESFNIWVLTAYQMLFGGFILLFASFILETPFFEVNLISVSVLLWLTLMASVVQFTIWFYLLQIGDPGKTSAFLFLAPFFGVLSGWLILGEDIRWYVMVGGAFIFVGIYLVNRTSNK